MKIFSFYFFILLSINGNTQNVGISTTLPTGKLQINHRATFASPTLLLYDSSSNNIGGPVLQFLSNGVNKFNIKGSLESGSNPAGSFLDYFYNSNYLATLTGTGRMTLGALDPHGRFLINHRAIEADPSLSIYDSSTSSAGRVKFFNAGGARYWQLRTSINNTNRSNQFFDIITDSSAIITLRANGMVGINKTVPVYPLDVNGDVNINGTFRVNGNAGNTGQVLTSNGAVDPSWKNTAFNNTTRFKILLTEGAMLNSDLECFAIYNTNTTDVVVNPTSITINKTGLYHLEGNISPNISYISAPGYTPDYYFNLYMGGNNPQVSIELRRRLGSATNFAGFDRYSMEIYIVAGSTIICSSSFNSSGTVSSFGITGYLRGHLISE